MTTLDARKKVLNVTRLAQGGGLVLLLGAGALAGVGLPLGRSDEAPKIELPPLPEPEGGENSESARAADALGISRRLAMVSNAPKPDPVDSRVEVGREPHPTPEEPVKFLGTIRLPSGPLAIVVFEGKQRLARLDSKFGDLTLSEIGEDHLLLEDKNGAAQRIEKAQPSGSLVTLVRGTPPGARTRPNIRIRGAEGDLREAMGEEVPSDEAEVLTDEEQDLKDQAEGRHLERVNNIQPPPSPPATKPGEPE